MPFLRKRYTQATNFLFYPPPPPSVVITFLKLEYDFFNSFCHSINHYLFNTDYDLGIGPRTKDRDVKKKNTTSHHHVGSNLEQWSPTFLAPGTGFGEDKFSTDGSRGGRWGGHVSGGNVSDGKQQKKLRSPATLLLLCGPVLRSWGPLI